MISKPQLFMSNLKTAASNSGILLVCLLLFVLSVVSFIGGITIVAIERFGVMPFLAICGSVVVGRIVYAGLTGK